MNNSLSIKRIESEENNEWIIRAMQIENSINHIEVVEDKKINANLDENIFTLNND